MYKVQRAISEKYGNIIEILRAEIGEESIPFFAIEQAKKQKRLWQEEGGNKIRFLVDNQILTTSQLEKWSKEEYKSLPKCEFCVKILEEQVYNNTLSSEALFCSQACADKDYHLQMDYLHNYEESDL